MKILAIDTSSNRCCIAVCENTTPLFETYCEDEKTHSQKLMPMLQESLKENNLALSDLDLLSCCIGPGSFTGIRIGISTIKAFADVTGLPTVGVNSLESLTYYFTSPGIYASMIDAKNDQVYFGLFERTLEQNTPKLLETLQADSICTILSNLSSYATIPITFLGDGALLHKEKIKQALPLAIFAQDSFNKSSGLNIAKSAYLHFINKQEKEILPISPLYLRKSQAERALEQKVNSNAN